MRRQRCGPWYTVHDAWWATVRRAHGDTAGARALIEVLLLRRSMAHDHIAAGIPHRAIGRRPDVSSQWF
jgi:hypothetical protein